LDSAKRVQAREPMQCREQFIQFHRRNVCLRAVTANHVFLVSIFCEGGKRGSTRSFLRHLNVECRMLIAEWWGPERRRGQEGHHLSRASLRQLMPAILDGLGDFAHPIRSGRYLVFTLYVRLEAPFLI